MNFSKHCNLCENRISSLKNGLTCRLTGKRPYFNRTCSKITFGKKFQEQLETANLELEIIRKNKKSTYIFFYGTIAIGFLLILLGYFFSDWIIHSMFLWEIKIGLIAAGFSFLGAANYKLNQYKRQNKKAELKKNKIDDVLNNYGISYHHYFDFNEKIHGSREVVVNIEFKNWRKRKTTNTYKYDY